MSTVDILCDPIEPRYTNKIFLLNGFPLWAVYKQPETKLLLDLG